MLIEHSWEIDRLDAHPDKEGKKNFVYAIHWRRKADDGEGHSSSSYGVQNVEENTASQFTPYEDLTQDQIIEWLESSMDEESFAKMDFELEEEVTIKAARDTVSPSLPWAEPPVSAAESNSLPLAEEAVIDVEASSLPLAE